MSQHQEKALRLQTFVILTEKDFCDYTGVCEVAFQWMLTNETLTLASMESMPRQERLSFKEFISFCMEFAKTDSSFRTQHKEVFLQLPMKGWSTKLRAIKSATHVYDAHSVSHYIKLFNQKYTEAVVEVDMREGEENTLISVPLKES